MKAKGSLTRVVFLIIGFILLYTGASKFFSHRDWGWYSALDLFLILFGLTLFSWNLSRLKRQ
jgi:hypothetical protein